MGIPVRNQEGYKDPTAAEAINNIEREQKRIRIGSIVEYKGEQYSVESIGRHGVETVCHLKGVSGLVPIKDVKKVIK